MIFPFLCLITLSFSAQKKLNPIVLLPPLYGTNLHATYNKTEVPWYCPKEMTDELLWVSTKFIIPPFYNCLVLLTQATYDEANDVIRNLPGVEISVKDFGGEESVDFVINGSYVKMVDNYASLIRFYKNKGYKIGENFFIAPYDWRMAPLFTDDFWPKLLNMIEVASSKNDKQKVTLLGFSMGSFMIQQFLTNEKIHNVLKQNHLTQIGQVKESLENIHETIKRLKEMIGNESNLSDDKKEAIKALLKRTDTINQTTEKITGLSIDEIYAISGNKGKNSKENNKENMNDNNNNDSNNNNSSSNDNDNNNNEKDKLFNFDIWKRKFIEKVVLLAPSFGGCHQTFDAVFNSYSPVVPIIRNEYVTGMVTSLPGFHSHFSNFEIFRGVPIVRGPDGQNFTSEECPDLVIREQRIKDKYIPIMNKSLEVQKEAPKDIGVPLAVLYNSGVPTLSFLDFGEGWKKEPKRTFGAKGDGTLQVEGPRWPCEHWDSKNKAIVCLDFASTDKKNYKHSAMPSNPFVHELLFNFTSSYEPSETNESDETNETNETNYINETNASDSSDINMESKRLSGNEANGMIGGFGNWWGKKGLIDIVLEKEVKIQKNKSFIMPKQINEQLYHILEL